mmetsp:Transcript_11391/g.23925  ORF Transcript_11391/g.23925 Transcript_11391/m.23925 type:complete len:209 (+) Transcript_11391:1458-2084(+)
MLVLVVPESAPFCFLSTPGEEDDEDDKDDDDQLRFLTSGTRGPTFCKRLSSIVWAARIASACLRRTISSCSFSCGKPVVSDLVLCLLSMTGATSSCHKWASRASCTIWAVVRPTFTSTISLESSWPHFVPAVVLESSASLSSEVQTIGLTSWKFRRGVWVLSRLGKCTLAFPLPAVLLLSPSQLLRLLSVRAIDGCARAPAAKFCSSA